MIGRSVVLGVALLFVVSATSHADTDGGGEKFLHRGPYLQLGGGIQVPKSSGDVDGALNGKIGIDVVEHVALEVQFEGSLDAERFAVTVQQRSAILSGRWQPYGVWGLGMSRTQRSPGTAVSKGVSGLAIRLGGGLDYMIQKNVALNLDTTYVILTQGSPDYASFSLGLRYGW